MNKLKDNIKDIYDSGVKSVKSVKREVMVEINISNLIKELKSKVVKIDYKLSDNKLKSEKDLNALFLEMKEELGYLTEAIEILNYEPKMDSDDKSKLKLHNLRINQLSDLGVPMNMDLILERVNIVNSVIEEIEDTVEEINNVKIHG